MSPLTGQVEDARTTMALFMTVREEYERALLNGEDCVAGLPGRVKRQTQAEQSLMFCQVLCQVVPLIGRHPCHRQMKDTFAPRLSVLGQSRPDPQESPWRSTHISSESHSLYVAIVKSHDVSFHVRFRPRQLRVTVLEEAQR